MHKQIKHNEKGKKIVTAHLVNAEMPHTHRRASKIVDCKGNQTLNSNPRHCLEKYLVFYKIMT